MKEQICQVLSEEELVAYAEGDLPPARAERIETHIEDCQTCQTIIDALERSLHVAQVIWRTDEAQWPKRLPVDKPKSNRRWIRPLTAVAASIFLVLGVGVTWRLLSDSHTTSHGSNKEPTVAEIEMAVNHAAMAAQMLAVADLLSSQPGGIQFAIKRYNDVITSFPETEQSIIARLHLQNLLERR